MKLEGTGYFSYKLEITPKDCIDHGINFDLIKKYEIYKQNKHLYDKIPDYYFEPPKPPAKSKKQCFLQKLFKKKEVPTENKETEAKPKTDFDVYFDKKFEELKAKGLPLYSKADLHRLYENEAKLTSLVKKFADSESEKEEPAFEDRGCFSYRYEISEDNIIIFHVNTVSMIL